jgi:serine-type D-Ala-D-Ala carboxypeptidase (penicillin-binding protein 5/6)
MPPRLSLVSSLCIAPRFQSCLGLGLGLSFSILVAGCASTAPTPAAAPSESMQPSAQVPHVFGNVPARFKFDATEAYLVDTHSGAVLYEFNSDARLQPGSLAKLMTFYLALNALSEKRVSLTSKVTVGDDVAAIAKDPTLSRMFLKRGQQVAFEDLLYGMMVHSGCDAAQAIADQLAGDAPSFVVKMNTEARRLGMTNTNFAQPNGLPAPGEYTTAHDMVILARALIREHPGATTYTSRHYFAFNGVNQKNTNGLLFLDSRVLGLKTGHVEQAGFHLVALARVKNAEFVSAVMGAPSDFRRTNDSELLVGWAFANFGGTSDTSQRAGNVH